MALPNDRFKTIGLIMSNNELTAEQIEEIKSSMPEPSNIFLLSSYIDVLMRRAFELGREAEPWTSEQPTREGFYLMRGAGRDSLELGLVQCDDEFKELCLFTGDCFDYLNTVQNLTRSIEWKLVALLSEGEKYA